MQPAGSLVQALTSICHMVLLLRALSRPWWPVFREMCSCMGMLVCGGGNSRRPSCLVAPQSVLLLEGA